MQIRLSLSLSWTFALGFLAILMLGVDNQAFGQSSRGNDRPTEQPASESKVFLDKAERSSRRDRKKGLKYKPAPTRNEFLEARLREKAKMAEEMKKPQYSNPLYFGHKRMPKKRPVHKRKLCKVCGIVH
ncbi:MAG: hypothetical protein MUC97_07655 [Bernardetiaceae bacterium]|jgi:hypothetical protein|nr:hypothetical protein [Bernardetiaceae bacterium]